MEREASRIDTLTGLPTFVELPAALSEPAAAIFLDIDGFRYVNRDFGPVAGDEVLARLGAWLKEEAEALRGGVFRVAGEELLLLLPGRTLSDAAEIAERLVGTCSRLQWPSVGSAGITLSAAVFLADPELPGRLRETLESLAEMLYQREVASGRAYGNVVIAG